jgi:hypothetical protein
MNKRRSLLGLGGLLCLLVLSSSPAQSFTPSTGSGAASLKPGGADMSINGGTGGVECQEYSGGEWIQEHTKERFVPHMTKCVEVIGGIKVAAAVNTGCEFVVSQSAPGVLKGTGGINAACAITRGSCVVKLAGGAPNIGLNAVSFAVVESKNDQVVSNIAGLTYVVSAACEELGLSSGSDGTLKSSVLALGQTP